jgi:WD40 repeat protein
VTKKKLQTAHSGDAYVVSVASSPDGNNILSGHVDGSIYLFSFSQPTKVWMYVTVYLTVLHVHRTVVSNASQHNG